MGGASETNANFATASGMKRIQHFRHYQTHRLRIFN
jgi:hypothetical protein